VSRALDILKSLLGDDVADRISGYLHEYDGTASSVKPVAKHVTIYWVGRLGAEAILRTEGEDDIILTRIRDKAVPTLIYRKFKATILRAYMETMRSLWARHRVTIQREVIGKHREVYGENYDFIASCGVSPGIEGGEGVMQQRCMKCPVDVLMGAVTGGDVPYNLASRLIGDPAYATTESYRRRTGNAVDEVTHTTGMGGVKTGGTGALYTETIVEPGTVFVGKAALFMPSAPELVYMLALMSHVHRYGARKSIMGSMEVYPVALVASMYEVGTAYAAAERALNKTSVEEAAKEVYSYLEDITTERDILVDLLGKRGELAKIDVGDPNLVVEVWSSAAKYVMGVREYVEQASRRRR
jgi:CRISPR type I-D-associated protein Csc2